MSTSSQQRPKVALAGAGQLGQHILTALLAANHPVVVLSRSTPSNLPTSPLLSTATNIDYNDAASIAPHLKGVHTVISTVGSLAISSQHKLIDAAHSAGVTRFIPSEFGSDTMHPKSATLPVYAGKVAVQDQLKELAAKPNGSPDGFSWTIVHNNAFLDSGLANGFICNVPERKMTRYDGGDTKISATKLETIAKAIVSGVLVKLDQTKNRQVRIQDVRTSQNEVLEILGAGKEGKGWEIEEFDTKKQREEGLEVLGRLGKGEKVDADIGKIMMGFIRSAAFAEGWGGDFEADGECDNELLGVKGMGKEEWTDYVKGFAK